ncbi:MAG: hypothetical protein ACNA8J_00015 [Gammaproteobacteria bacterium]
MPKLSATAIRIRTAAAPPLRAQKRCFFATLDFAGVSVIPDKNRVQVAET